MLLDVRGEMCPYPAMKTKEALPKLKAGEDLVILTDHAPALSTVPWEGARLGFTSDITVTGPGEWRIELQKAAGKIDTRRALTEIAERAAALAGE